MTERKYIREIDDKDRMKQFNKEGFIRGEIYVIDYKELT